MASPKNFICPFCNIGLSELCNCFSKCVVGDFDESEIAAGILWCHDLGDFSGGQFSHAVIKANSNVEDHSHVETADGAMFVGVYDGHGGDVTSNIICRDLFPAFNTIARNHGVIDGAVLTQTFAQMETAFTDFVRASLAQYPDVKVTGSCCLVGVIWRGTLFVANAGDSRVVIGRKCPVGIGMWAEQITSDDNVNNAPVRAELRAAHPNDNGIVTYANGSWRVKGIIQVSRSIGDLYLKTNEFNFPPGHPKHMDPPLATPILSPVPRIYSRVLTKRDRFLIFATDGLWELLSNRRAVEIVLNNPRNGIARRLIREAVFEAAKKAPVVTSDGSEPTPEMKYEALRATRTGLRRQFHDDISMVVVFLDSPPAEPPQPLHIRAFSNEPIAGRFDLNGIN